MAHSQNSTRSLPGKRQIALFVAFVTSLYVPLLLSVVGCFLSLWIVIPAPTFALLPLGIGAPEVSLWLIGINAIALIHALLTLPKGWLFLLAITLSAIGLGLSTLPLRQFPAAEAKIATEFQTVLGRNYLKTVPAEVQARMRSYPFVWWDALRGIPAPTVRVTKAIPFAQPDGVKLSMNVYQPPGVGQYPTIVTIYGGAWRSGSPHNDETFNRYIAAQGYTVISIDYRHAPQYRFPAQLEDVQTALTYIQHQAEALEVDRERVVLMGRSAGAHLAMLAAYKPGPLPIKALVNYYGPVNLTRGYQEPPQPDPINTHKVLTEFLGGSPDELPDLYRQASPIHYVAPSLPPSLLVYAGRDHLVKAQFGWALYQQLQSTGNRVVWIEIPWAEHAFDAVFNGVSNQLALYYTERFLAWALTGKN